VRSIGAVPRLDATEDGLLQGYLAARLIEGLQQVLSKAWVCCSGATGSGAVFLPTGDRKGAPIFFFFFCTSPARGAFLEQALILYP
jgi:hypothetical protein